MRPHPMGVAPEPLGESEIRAKGSTGMLIPMPRSMRPVGGLFFLDADGCARAHLVGVATEPLGESEI
jgi:hypothetical protein